MATAKKKSKRAKRLLLPRMSDEDLRQFVDDVVSNRVFTSAHLRDHELKLLHLVFMPIAFGALVGYETKDIGVIWERQGQAGQRGINGLPMFPSCHIMHKDDWARAKVAIDKEFERRKTIAV